MEQKKYIAVYLVAAVILAVAVPAAVLGIFIRYLQQGHKRKRRNTREKTYCTGPFPYTDVKGGFSERQ